MYALLQLRESKLANFYAVMHKNCNQVTARVVTWFKTHVEFSGLSRENGNNVSLSPRNLQGAYKFNIIIKDERVESPYSDGTKTRWQLQWMF